jgi:hypothetical protein
MDRRGEGRRHYSEMNSITPDLEILLKTNAAQSF